MRAFLIGDTSNRTNWGCRATTTALRRLIEQRATISARLDVGRFATPLAPDERPAVARAPGGPGTGRSGLQRSWAAERAMTALARRRPELARRRPAMLRGIQWDDFPALAELIAAGKVLPRVRDAIADADVVVINGEGSFLQRRFPGRLKMLLAYTAKTALGTPCALVNHTSDVRDPVMHEIAAHVYPLLDDVRFRDPISLARSGPLCGGAPHGLAADAAFTLGPGIPAWRQVAAQDGYLSIFPDDAGGFDPTQPYICVGGSSAHLAEERPGFDPVAAYSDLCRALSELAPVVVTAASHPDDRFLGEVARRLGLPSFGLRTPTPLAVDLLSSSALYVGGRWHPGILASTGGTPVVMLSANTPYKSDGFLQLLDLEQAPISAFEVSTRLAEVVACAEAHLAAGEALRARLADRARELARSAEGNVGILEGVRCQP